MKARSAVPLVALLVVFAVHAMLTLRLERPETVLGPYPIPYIDYHTHYEQALRALEAFEGWGELWAYDPHLLAGSIAGAIFDADNKLLELWVIALHKLGIAPHRGFNLFIVLGHLLVVPSMFASARLFGIGAGGAVLAAAFASLFWWFDAMTRWILWTGMMCWCLAACLSVLAVGLFFRWTVSQRPAWLAGTFALLALLHQLHPYAFFVVIIPFGILFLRKLPALPRRDHVMVAAGIVVVLLANVWWLRTAMRFWHHVLRSDYYMSATPSYALTDWLRIRQPFSITGPIGPRTAVRSLVLGLALVGLWSLARRRDARVAPLAFGAFGLLALAYLGTVVPGLAHVQPYRFLIPAVLFATLPAAAYVEHVARRLREETSSRWMLGPAIALGLVVVPALAEDVVHLQPALLPEHPAWRVGVHPELRHDPLDEVHRRLARFVRKHDDGRSRWLVEDWVQGEFLAWATNAQILGGFRELNLEHSDANWFRNCPEGVPEDPSELSRYFERYAVGWVVVTRPLPAFEGLTDMLELAADVAGHRVYRTKVAPSLVVGDPDANVKASLNRLQVRGARGGDVVLRYHFLETLTCRPDCRVSREPVDGDRVGFIRVEDAPADFEISNDYRFR